MTGSLTNDINESKSVKEALIRGHLIQWKNVMDSEYNSLIQNNTWKLAPPPEGKNIVCSKWFIRMTATGRSYLHNF